MAERAHKSKYGIVLRATSGARTVADRPLPIFDLEDHRRAIVHIMQEAGLTTPDADDRVRFLLETAYGAGNFVDPGAGFNTVGEWGGGTGEAEQNLETQDSTLLVVGDVIRVDQERMLVVGIGAAFGGVNFVRVRRGHRGDPVQVHADATDIFIQDVDWITVANITYDNTDNTLSRQAVVVVGEEGTTPIIADNLETALADNTVLAMPLGDRLRIRTTVAGATAPTYNYSARASFEN